MSHVMIKKLSPTPESAGGVAVSQARWSVFERFLSELESCGEPDRQLMLLLDNVLEVSRAQAVALVPFTPTDPVVATGPVPLSADNARGIVNRLLEATPPSESQHAAVSYDQSNLAGLFRGWKEAAPTSAILVRVSRGRSSWVLAVTTDPNRQFAAGSVGAVRLAARLFRTHQKATRYAADVSAALLGVVQGFAAAIDAKDPYTYGHSERVARMASLVGRRMGLPESTVNDLYLSGLLHDVGKIGVPESVLSKPGRLTDEEFRQIQAHPVIGDKILAGIRQFDLVRPGVRSHHERWDGRGYPDRLAGDAIPLLGRVLAVADTCDAMLSARPYRAAMNPRQVEAELLKGRGVQWDPRAVDGFLACRREIYATRDGGLGNSVYAAVNNAVEVSTGSLLAPAAKTGPIAVPPTRIVAARV